VEHEGTGHSRDRPHECDRRASGRSAAASRMSRLRRGFAWFVVGLLVFMLVATLLLEGAA
jgi:hypothetical protein